MATDATPAGSTPDFNLLMKAVPGCAALVDGLGIIKAVNSAWSAADTVNPFLRDLGPGSDYLAHCQILTRSEDGNLSLVAASILSALRGKIRHISLEYPVPAGARVRWFSVTITGGDASVVIAHLDITGRMAWEARVRSNERLFKATAENALDLIAIVAADGRTVYASPSYGKTLGHGPVDLAGGRLLDLVSPEDQAVFRENCNVGLSSGLSPLFEYAVRHQDGQVRRLEARVVAVDNPGGEREAILIISRDISAKKEAEQERGRMEGQLRHAQKMEAIGQLAAGIAHEINTPCQYLNDNLRFLQESFSAFDQLTGAAAGTPELAAVMAELDIAYLAEEVPRAIQQSLEGLARIAIIVQAMKVFGHPGGDERVAVDLNETLRNTVVVAQGEWKYVAEVDCELDPHLPQVLCPPGEMNQVFLNLLVNAAHAIADRAQGGPGAKGRIAISSAIREGWVEIRVRDTGSGIPEAIRDQIFLPFFTTKPVGKGTGQGLAIAHSVVTRNGGTIDFESEVGHGTCFIVRLPPGSLTM